MTMIILGIISKEKKRSRSFLPMKTWRTRTCLRWSDRHKAVVNAFVKQNKKGTLMGNILFRRYLMNTKVCQKIAGSERTGKV